MTITLAVDAMGGDHGPRVTVPASLRFVEDTPDGAVILVGLEPALRTALAASRSPARDRVTIRADVRSPDSSRYIREALISFGENGRPFLVREWRHGDIDPAAAASSASRDDNQGSERNCLRPADVANS